MKSPRAESSYTFCVKLPIDDFKTDVFPYIFNIPELEDFEYIDLVIPHFFFHGSIDIFNRYYTNFVDSLPKKSLIRQILKTFFSINFEIIPTISDTFHDLYTLSFLIGSVDEILRKNEEDIDDTSKTCLISTLDSVIKHLSKDSDFNSEDFLSLCSIEPTYSELAVERLKKNSNVSLPASVLKRVGGSSKSNSSLFWSPRYLMNLLHSNIKKIGNSDFSIKWAKGVLWFNLWAFVDLAYEAFYVGKDQDNSILSDILLIVESVIPFFKDAQSCLENPMFRFDIEKIGKIWTNIESFGLLSNHNYAIQDRLYYHFVKYQIWKSVINLSSPNYLDNKAKVSASVICQLLNEPSSQSSTHHEFQLDSAYIGAAMIANSWKLNGIRSDSVSILSRKICRDFSDNWILKNIIKLPKIVDIVKERYNNFIMLNTTSSTNGKSSITVRKNLTELLNRRIITTEARQCLISLFGDHRSHFLNMSVFEESWLIFSYFFDLCHCPYQKPIGLPNFSEDRNNFLYNIRQYLLYESSHRNMADRYNDNFAKSPTFQTLSQLVWTSLYEYDLEVKNFDQINHMILSVTNPIFIKSAKHLIYVEEFSGEKAKADASIPEDLGSLSDACYVYDVCIHKYNKLLLSEDKISSPLILLTAANSFQTSPRNSNDVSDYLLEPILPILLPLISSRMSVNLRNLALPIFNFKFCLKMSTDEETMIENLNASRFTPIFTDIHDKIGCSKTVINLFSFLFKTFDASHTTMKFPLSVFYGIFLDFVTDVLIKYSKVCNIYDSDDVQDDYQNPYTWAAIERRMFKMIELLSISPEKMLGALPENQLSAEDVALMSARPITFSAREDWSDDNDNNAHDYDDVLNDPAHENEHVETGKNWSKIRTLGKLAGGFNRAKTGDLKEDDSDNNDDSLSSEEEDDQKSKMTRSKSKPSIFGIGRKSQANPSKSLSVNRGALLSKMKEGSSNKSSGLLGGSSTDKSISGPPTKGTNIPAWSHLKRSKYLQDLSISSITIRLYDLNILHNEIHKLSDKMKKSYIAELEGRADGPDDTQSMFSRSYAHLRAKTDDEIQIDLLNFDNDLVTFKAYLLNYIEQIATNLCLKFIQSLFLSKKENIFYNLYRPYKSSGQSVYTIKDLIDEIVLKNGFITFLNSRFPLNSNAPFIVLIREKIIYHFIKYICSVQTYVLIELIRSRYVLNKDFIYPILGTDCDAICDLISDLKYRNVDIDEWTSYANNFPNRYSNTLYMKQVLIRLDPSKQKEKIKPLKNKEETTNTMAELEQRVKFSTSISTVNRSSRGSQEYQEPIVNRKTLNKRVISFGEDTIVHDGESIAEIAENIDEVYSINQAPQDSDDYSPTSVERRSIKDRKKTFKNRLRNLKKSVTLGRS